MVVRGAVKRNQKSMPFRRVSIVALISVSVFALILGTSIPSIWQIPAMLLLAMFLGAYAALRIHGYIVVGNTQHGSRHDMLMKSVDDLRRAAGSAREENAKLAEAVSFQFDEIRMRILGIENRAHNDEMRLREIGQLARQSTNYSQSIFRQLKADEDLRQASTQRTIRPAASNVVPLEGPKRVGRLAAAVLPDENRAEKLLQAVSFHSEPAESEPESIAVIGTIEFQKYLKELGLHVVMLMPGTSKAQLARSQPAMLVLEEASFSAGAWYGADSASGTTLFAEITNTCSSAEKLGIQVLMIENSSRPDIYSSGIRSSASYSFPATEFAEGWAKDTNLGIMRVLQNYAVRDWNNK